jgi:hypothetical protein
MSASLGEFAEHRILEAQAYLDPCFYLAYNALEVKNVSILKDFSKR